MLLGYASIRTAEEYYAPWAPARPAKLTEAVKRAWERDPIASANAIDTQLIHEAEPSVKPLKTKALKWR